MKNKRKLMINCMFICISLIGIIYANFYFGGYYLDEDESIQEYLEIKNIEDSTCVFKLQERIDVSYALYENVERGYFHILKTTHHLLGYKTNFAYSGLIEGEEELSVNGVWQKEEGMHVILYRNNPDIAYVELKMINNNDEYVFSKWLNEYSWKNLDYNDWEKGKYYSYDKDGNLLDVKEF